MKNKKIIKMCIFSKDATPSQVTTSNGDAILDNIIVNSETDEHLQTGEYYLDFTALIDENHLHKYLEEEAIVKVHMDYGDEIFKIAKVKRTSRDITCFARQITIAESLDMWIEDIRPTGKSGQAALSELVDRSIGNKNIKVSSDILNTSTAYYQYMNLYKALFDCEQSFINRWGGEIQRRGYLLSINKKIGTNRSVQIRSRKNLTGFESDTNIDNVVTRIKPVGFDGITIDGYIDSPLINMYSTVKTRKIKYEDIKVKKENPDGEEVDNEGFDTLEEAQEELIKRAKLEFSKNHIDQIKADYRINFVQLEYTEEYKNYIQAERVFLGDEVEVYEEKLDTSITARTVRRKFDVLRQRVIEIELSNEVEKKKAPTISDIANGLGQLEDNIKENNEWYQNAINNATDMIENGLKDSYVITRKNEILIMDTQDINTARNVWRFNNGGLGHSSTGYWGKYETAITQDGSIVGEFITGLLIKGDQIDAKNLNVFNNKGKKTLEITADGEVALNVKQLLIQNENIDDFTINKIQEEINNLSQEEIFNLLTNNGRNQGIYLLNGRIYLNGEFLKAHSISVNSLSSNNENPIITLFGQCAIDATYRYGVGQGNAIRFKWDDYNYMKVSAGRVSFFSEDMPEIEILEIISDGSSTTIVTPFGNLEFSNDGISYRNRRLAYADEL